MVQCQLRSDRQFDNLRAQYSNYSLIPMLGFRFLFQGTSQMSSLVCCSVFFRTSVDDEYSSVFMHLVYSQHKLPQIIKQGIKKETQAGKDDPA